jgi:TctA family transporter
LHLRSARRRAVLINVVSDEIGWIVVNFAAASRLSTTISNLITIAAFGGPRTGKMAAVLRECRKGGKGTATAQPASRAAAAVAAANFMMFRFPDTLNSEFSM